MRKYLQFKKYKIKNVIWEKIRDSLDFGIFITYHLKMINPTNARFVWSDPCQIWVSFSLTPHQRL